MWPVLGSSLCFGGVLYVANLWNQGLPSMSDAAFTFCGKNVVGVLIPTPHAPCLSLTSKALLSDRCADICWHRAFGMNVLT